jgi:hypothetical protein
VARVTTRKCRALSGSSAAGASNTSEFQLSILPLFHYFLSRLLAWNAFKPNLSILKPQRNTAIYSMNFKNKKKDNVIKRWKAIEREDRLIK